MCTRGRYESMAVSVRAGAPLPVAQCRAAPAHNNDPHQWKLLCVEGQSLHTHPRTHTYTHPHIFIHKHAWPYIHAHTWPYIHTHPYIYQHRVYFIRLTSLLNFDSEDKKSNVYLKVIFIKFVSKNTYCIDRYIDCSHVHRSLYTIVY